MNINKFGKKKKLSVRTPNNKSGFRSKFKRETVTSCACANFRLKLENIRLMFSSLNSANSKWRRVAEDPGMVGKR